MYKRSHFNKHRSSNSPLSLISDGSDARLSYYTASSFVSLDFKGASCTITNADD